MSRVFCDLRSQKTPRGILPVNSNYFISFLYCLNEKRFTKKREYGIIIEENTAAEL